MSKTRPAGPGGLAKSPKRPTLLRDADPTELEALAPIIRALASDFMDAMRAGEIEAEALLEAAGDDSDFPTLAAHLEAHPPSASAIVHLVWRVRELTASKKQSTAAASRNVEPRKWVQQEWRARTDLAQAKASFARQHASLVKRKFQVDVTAKTISDRWLAGC